MHDQDQTSAESTRATAQPATELQASPVDDDAAWVGYESAMPWIDLSAGAGANPLMSVQCGR